MIEQQAEAAKAQPLPPLDQLPPDMVRAGYRAQRQAQDQNAPRGVETRDLMVGGAAGEIPGRLYRPAGVGDPSGLLVYFHGGGFVIGDLETQDGHSPRLPARSGRRVPAPDYRLPPH